MTHLKRFLKRISICFFSIALSLWVVDVLINYQILNNMISRKTCIAKVQNDIGLFLADTKLGLILTIICLTGAWIVTALVKKTDFWSETIIMLSAGISSLTFYGCLVYAYEVKVVSVYLLLFIV
ncbi:hypothetical protein KKB18_06020, partial [bacterium]|nr:hypothetical protein [bacterium]